MHPHPRDTWPKPPAHRILLAFAGAPTFATALAAGAGLIGSDGVHDIPFEIFFIFIFGLLFVALPLTVVVGVPLFLVLRKRVRPSFWACSLAGAAVLCLPVLVFLLVDLTMKEVPDMAAYGHVTVLHGQRTIWWWLESAVVFGGAAALGLVAGFVFWLIAAAGLKPEKLDAAVVHSVAQPPPLEGAETDRVMPEKVPWGVTSTAQNRVVRVPETFLLPPDLPASVASLVWGVGVVTKVQTVAFQGIEAVLVDVQVQIAPGVPAFLIL